MRKVLAILCLIYFLPYLSYCQNKNSIDWEYQTKVYESVLSYLAKADTLEYLQISNFKLSVDPKLIFKKNPNPYPSKKNTTEIPEYLIRSRKNILDSLGLNSTEINYFSECQNYDAFRAPPPPDDKQDNDTQEIVNSDCQKLRGQLGIAFGKVQSKDKRHGNVRVILFNTYSYRIYEFNLRLQANFYKVTNVKLIEFVAS